MAPSKHPAQLDLEQSAPIFALFGRKLGGVAEVVSLMEILVHMPPVSDRIFPSTHVSLEFPGRCGPAHPD